ncbi:MAG: DUF2107 domain-containing protein [Methanococci archaeon]|uniref:(NiFe)-hydrogenase-3-type complex Eha, membrane protein EhaE n=1 Tax=Methanocaldococcus vulcanius (strain ATCC 700851 / DSM 12094 / M7) TaxID=579137 RepID=C9RFI5_METVM|nr:EhaE family protein [Methanocaldococcus vulcanius]ACX72337.1 (NiFe)-hydrogenase-3-type complex Eha, membrane protein EhaE [Methanocaldococcus vulcanius M7]NPA62561.1 DUF2107 domain-containing protein [Methanococci archaeon]
MDLVQYILYLGYALLIIGTLGAILGPKVEDPLIRFLNVEVPSIGVALIFLTYDEDLALMTFIAVNAILSLILIRALILKEKYESE